MSRPVSGEIKTSTVRIKRSNGDVYVYERKMKYDPKVGYTKTFDSRLLGKIKAGTNEMISTRPRRKPSMKPISEAVAETNSVKEWAHVGATDILQWVGKQSGIDEDAYATWDEGTAQKFLTAARYLVANPGQTMPRIGKWQRTHPTPSETELSRKNVQLLMETIGQNKGAQMAYFKCRANRSGKSDVLAIDSTTVSTYSENLISARQGFNKDHDGLDTVKLLTVYSLKTKQPIGVTKQPGNIPDVISIENALKQMNWLKVESYKVVTDNGFYSQDNIVRFIQSNTKFLTLANKDRVWIRDEIEKHREELFSVNAICPDDMSTHGITVTVTHPIKWERQRSRNGIEKGETQKKSVRLYLHIYLNRDNVAKEERALLRTLNELSEQVKAGETEFNATAQNKINTFLIVRKYRGKITTKINNKAWNDAQTRMGIFVLLTNKKSTTFEALAEYRLREKIEESYRALKGFADGDCTRSWYDDNLTGRVFCQTVALGYRLYFQEAVKAVQAQLKERLPTDTETEWKAKEGLRKWLDQKSLVDILDWFDCIELTRLNNGASTVSLKTELTSRDKLFLTMLKATPSIQAKEEPTQTKETPAEQANSPATPTEDGAAK